MNDDRPTRAALLARYSPLLDDPAAFAAALDRPLPTTVWAHPGRWTPAQAEAWLLEAGYEPQPIPWRSGAFRLRRKLGRVWPYLAGLLHVQEEASMVPAALLAPEAGCTVLDACAAPGNKSAELALRVGEHGCVVANERSIGRTPALRATVERLALLNVVCTLEDATRLSPDFGLFDHVLVDAPCSCEGTYRKSGEPRRRKAAHDHARMAAHQSRILLRAARHLRVGGRLVYSTCTFAPEENEGVLQTLLDTHPGEFALRPAHLPGLPSAPGLTQLEGRTLDPSLRLSLRVWPHLADTGGFFAALLERVAAPKDALAASVSTSTPTPPRRQELTAHAELHAELITRWALPTETLHAYELHLGSQRGPSLTTKSTADHLPATTQSAGVFALGLKAKPPKPTTAAALAFGQHATAGYLELDEVQLDAYLRRRTQALPPWPAGVAPITGHVLIRHRGFGLGLGWIPREATTLESAWPKAWALSPDEAGTCK